MPRARKPIELSPERKKELRRVKNRERRQQRKAQAHSAVTQSQTPHDDQQLWSGINARANAMRVLNPIKARPYWLSIPHVPGNPPVAGYFPCTSFYKEGRWYYGFLFRVHREKLVKKWRYARREWTGGVASPLISS